MKNKYIFRAFLAGIVTLVMMLSAFGCSLAVEGAGEGEESISRDQMIGVFITTEPLIFDWDAEKRIFATVDKGDSSEPHEWDIYFEGIDGINFFDGIWKSENGNSFNMLTCGEEVCDIKTHYMSTDEGEGVELSGTVYNLPTNDLIYYSNPVYQTPDGKIYTVGGDGNHIGTFGLGGKLTTTLTDEVKVTEDGVTETNKISVQITYEGEYEPVEITVCQMDNNNQIVKTEKYAPGALPEAIKAERETAYIIVETKRNNPENPDDSIRELYTRSETGHTYFETFRLTNKGRLGKMSTRIEW